MPLNDPTSNFFPRPALDALLDRAEQLRPSPAAEAQARKLIERDLPIAEVDFPGFIGALNEAKAGIGAFDRMFGSERAYSLQPKVEVR